MHDKIMHQWIEETRGLIDKKLGKKGLSHPFIYMNDAHGDQDPFNGYGGQELKRLKKVRDQYDSDRLWKKGLVGGFKIAE